MAASKDYQRYAARCLQEARTTTDSEHRTLLVEMAQTWQRLIEYAANIKSPQVSFVSEPDRGD
jgi:hypothetical protein